MDGCFACDLSEGRTPLPGGRILEAGGWLVEHSVGPLGVGTLIVKPKRHIVHVWDLSHDEASDLGPLLRRVSEALNRLLLPDQVYVTLWSHANGVPGHIHWVVQPISRELMAAIGSYGPNLQVAMFERAETPDFASIEDIANRLRHLLPA